MWDEARIFTGNDYFKDGIKAPVTSGSLLSSTAFSGSSLEIYKNDNLSEF
jgi:diaminohydroxyphosphoribosylaminopyrimidine deaminase/5-amino-6-(5-phosphoribosylamino)uracil reductase